MKNSSAQSSEVRGGEQHCIELFIAQFINKMKPASINASIVL